MLSRFSSLSEVGSNSRPVRRLGLFDAVMIVMGGIIGAGILVNPQLVANHVRDPLWTLGLWAGGGVFAFAGALIYSELASSRPDLGGQYAYLREVYHPSVSFCYAWVLLLAIQSGGQAASAVTFARYASGTMGGHLPEPVLAGVALAVLGLVNCFGARWGSNAVNVLMVAKIGMLLAIIAIGAALGGAPTASTSPPAAWPPGSLAVALASALVPIIFAYGGWQTATFVTLEMKSPQRDLPRALALGVSGVVAVYVALNLVCYRALGAEGLSQSRAPVAALIEAAVGRSGARLAALAVAISTLGFLSQGMLTAPRVYWAMGRDMPMLAGLGRLSANNAVPIRAIVGQVLLAILIVVSGTYEQILSYVVTIDFLFCGLTAACLFSFRSRGGRDAPRGSRVPGHPITTAAFVGVCALIVASGLVSHPRNGLCGLLVVGSGFVAYFLCRRSRTGAST